MPGSRSALCCLCTTLSALLLLTALLLAPASTLTPLQAAEPGHASPGAGAGAGAALVVTYTAGDQKATQAARLPALHVPEGATPSPFIPSAYRQWIATFRGQLTAELRRSIRLHVVGRGAVTVKVNDTVVLRSEGNGPFDLSSEPVELQQGHNAFELTLEAAKAGDTLLRTSWSSRDFMREPIPATAFARTSLDSAAYRGLDIERGRKHFADLMCIRCHTADLPDTVMPELTWAAASLDGAGTRFQQAWLADYIQNPTHFRADSRMPRVLPVRSDDKPSDDAWHLAAYVLRDAAAPPAATPDKTLVAEGQKLFLALGCIACHTTPDKAGDDQTLAIDRLPLHHVKLKFRSDALAAYLSKPHAHDPARRMPDFSLTADETAALTAYLWHTATATLDHTPPATLSVERGKLLYETLGCANCHDTADDSKLIAPSLEAIHKAHTQTFHADGCLVPTSGSKRPYYDALRDTATQKALADFLRHPRLAQVLKQDTPASFAARQIESLRCAACHTYDGQADAWTQLEDEIAALLPEEEAAAPVEDAMDYYDEPDADGGEEVDQSRPLLTWVGEKLQPGYMTRVFKGDLDPKPRPWLHARMPAFPIVADALPRGLAAQHGYSDAVDATKVDAELVVIGRRLVGADNGFGCTQCHAVGDAEATSVFEAQGVNFMLTTERLRKDYYDRWVFQPQRIMPDTKMPRYADEDGKSPFQDVLGGDARKQYDAIWHYLQAGRSIEPPSR